jgi:hypothetical protein
MPDLWSSLDSPERVKRIMKVMTRAAKMGEKQFHDDCLGLNGADSRKTIEGEAGVTFDKNFVLQCYGDRASIENQIVLLFPSEGSTVTTPVRNYWLCTYVDYIPEKHPEEQSTPP